MFASLRKELNMILKHRILFVVTCIILLIPCIYAGPFISSYWDPYAHVKDLPLVIVNHDVGTTINDEKVNIGQQLTDDLKNSDELKVLPADENAAIEGMKNNKYYMLIRVPKDFSKNAMSAFENDQKKAQLEIVPNEGYNFTGASISNSAMEKVKSELEHKITKSYTTAILEAEQKLGEGLDKLANGGNQLSDGVTSAKQGSTSLENGIEQFAKGTLKFNQGIMKLSDGTKPIDDGAKSLASGLSGLDQGMGKLADGADKLASGMKYSADKSVDLKNGVQQLVNGTSELESKVALIGKANQGGLAQVTQELDSLTSSNQNANDSSAALDKAQQDLKSSIENNNALSAEDKQKMLDQLNLLSSKYTEAIKQNGSNVKIDEVKKHLQEQVEGMGGRQAMLEKGLAQITAGQAKLLESTQKFADGQARLAAGASDLSEGIHGAKQGADQLAAGGQRLADGIDQFAAGTDKIKQASSSLLNGSEKLEQGSLKLTNGLSKLQNGSSELAEGINTADQKVNEKHSNADAAAELISDPVELQKVPFNHIAQYGPAFAPYFLSLGLYVGMFLFCSSFPLLEIRPGQSARNWFIGKLGVLLIIGTLQALILDALIILMKIHVQNIGYFILFSILASWAFTAILLFLNTALDKIGRFVSMGLLILQLTSCGGSFPLEMQSSFFQHVHGWVPMSYTVLGFKSIISMPDSPSSFLWNSCLSLLVFMIIGIVLSFAYYTHHFKKHHSKAATTTAAPNMA
ncbi:YhgE/Pip domain-containing protein [Paenibacillus sediminis]|nr:YhgE/Pip domain-containing protein [Paenibacillus sediminis]